MVSGNALKNGINTLGCPSVSMFVNDNNFFDVNINYMIDCELFFTLYNKYGKPHIIEDKILVIRNWFGNLDKDMAQNKKLLENDIQYLNQRKIK